MRPKPQPSSTASERRLRADNRVTTISPRHEVYQAGAGLILTAMAWTQKTEQCRLCVILASPLIAGLELGSQPTKQNVSIEYIEGPGKRRNYFSRALEQVTANLVEDRL